MEVTGGAKGNKRERESSTNVATVGIVYVRTKRFFVATPCDIDITQNASSATRNTVVG